MTRTAATATESGPSKFTNSAEFMTGSGLRVEAGVFDDTPGQWLVVGVNVWRGEEFLFWRLWDIRPREATVADEATVNATLSFLDTAEADTLFLQAAVTPDVTTKRAWRGRQAVGTSSEALEMGDVTAPGWAMLKNLDATNYVEVLAASGGAVVGKMLAGESYGPVRLGSGMQAPFVRANTAACDVAVLVVST